MATRLKKKRKTLLTQKGTQRIKTQIEKSKSKEEEVEVKEVEIVKEEPKDPTGRKPWKPIIEMINCAIINDGIFVQLNKYYHFTRLLIEFSQKIQLLGI